MANRTVYHVVPSANSWAVKRQEQDEFEYLVDDKDHALAHAKDLARQAPLGQVIVHGRPDRRGVHLRRRSPLLERLTQPPRAIVRAGPEGRLDAQPSSRRDVA